MPSGRSLACLLALALAACAKEPAAPEGAAAGARSRPVEGSPVEGAGAPAGRPATRPAARPATRRAIARFARWVSREPPGGRFEIAITQFEDARGRRVDLVGAVHVADPAFYDALNERFQSYDAVLYELVAPQGMRPPRPADQTPSLEAPPPEGEEAPEGRGVPQGREAPERGEGSEVEKPLEGPATRAAPPGGEAGPPSGAAPPSPAREFHPQRFLADLLGLSFQLDRIDYHAANFVHADLDPEALAEKLLSPKGLLGLLFSGAATGAAASGEEQARRLSGGALQMLVGLLSPQRATYVKAGMAQVLMAMLEEGGGAISPSPLIGPRNEAALAVLDRELEAGRRKLAIFYGVAHMPDFAARLGRRGFHRTKTEWLTAWDCRLSPEQRARLREAERRRRARRARILEKRRARRRGR